MFQFLGIIQKFIFKMYHQSYQNKFYIKDDNSKFGTLVLNNNNIHLSNENKDQYIQIGICLINFKLRYRKGKKPKL